MTKNLPGADFSARKRYHSTIMRLRDILIAVFALALLGGLTVLLLNPAKLEQVPDITLTTLQGKELSTAELHGRPVLVNFWATSCSGCIREMPHLIELYEELSPHGLEMIGIAMAYDPPNRVVAFSRSRQLPYPIALDIQGRAAKAFGDVRVTPSTFVIAPDGRVVHHAVGALDPHKLRTLLLDMLARKNLSHKPLQVS